MIERTPLTQEQMGALMSPLNPARVQNRRQGGSSLSYLAGWDVKATLIRVFGFGGWDAEVIESQVLEINRIQPGESGNRTDHVQVEVVAKATMRLGIHQTGAVYSEVAVSSQKGRDVGEVADFAIKTAETDALKRCAINLGTQFGLSLYDQGSTSEVVRRVFAPGQEWGGPTQGTPEQEATLARSLGQQPLPERDINDDARDAANGDDRDVDHPDEIMGRPGGGLNS